eukprot:TRINITY_DN19227_c0_g1_i1.p1 TRINITY_DN19227_c0_g1~~TRINITY_DN19227_c0_g1_i1.p1  ORF type:complete len:477 (+),score=93.44 TRINITY_DN19227_c0_g1_i1:76-1506(+)
MGDSPPEFDNIQEAFHCSGDERGAAAQTEGVFQESPKSTRHQNRLSSSTSTSVSAKLLRAHTAGAPATLKRGTGLQDIKGSAGASILNLFEGKDFTCDAKSLWLPDPQDILEELQEERASLAVAETKLSSVRAAQKAKAKRETSVENYLKAHATAPHLQESLNEHVENAAAFAKSYTNFLTGVFDKKVYVVTAMQRVGIRWVATFDTDAISDVPPLIPGECVIADFTAVIDGTTWLKLNGSGWVFQTCGETTVMTEMLDCEVGFWWYRQICETEHVETRWVPTYGTNSRASYLIAPEEAFVVVCRCTVNGQKALRMSDGRGWVFLNKKPRQSYEQDVAVFEECLSDVAKQVHRETIRQPKFVNLETLQGAMESGLWSYRVLDQPVLMVGLTMYGTELFPNELLVVDLKVNASGQKMKGDPLGTRTWLRVQNRGWIPKKDAEGRSLVKLVAMGGKARPSQSNLSVVELGSEVVVGVV